MNDTHDHTVRDRLLVNQLLGGNRTAFAEVIAHSEKIVANIVFKMIASREDRKDIAQDIYLKVFRKMDTFRFQSKLSTWIAQIAYHTCFNYLDKKKLVLLEDYDEQDKGLGANEAENHLSEKDLKIILAAAIDQLPVIQKTLISLYHLEELNYDEICQITGLPQGTVKSYLYRARKALKDSITQKHQREDL